MLLSLLAWLSLAGGMPATADFAAQEKPAAETQAEEKKKKERPQDFVIFGNVFTEQGFSLPGVEAAVRVAGEKKIRWRAVSDRRGEFAVHVPGGAEYEVTVRAKGFQEQTRKVNGRSGIREDCVFRMQRPPGGKNQ